MNYLYQLANLSEGVWRIDGEPTLLPRRVVYIPESSRDWKRFKLETPMTLPQLSRRIYGDESMWALLVEWNGLESPPGRWMVERLPKGFEVRYMSFDRYAAIISDERAPDRSLRGVDRFDEE